MSIRTLNVADRLYLVSTHFSDRPEELRTTTPCDAANGLITSRFVSDHTESNGYAGSQNINGQEGRDFEAVASKSSYIQS